MTPTPQSVLARIYNEACQAHHDQQRLLAVFDLDSTLLDLTLRISTIVDAFAATPENRKKFPKECELLKTIQLERADWGIGEALVRVGLSADESPDFWNELHKYWASCFFSNQYLHHDEPLPGAVEYVCALRDAGADIMYLTGRDIPRMKTGTEESLKQRGFPLGEGQARLILKPSASLDDAAFKVLVLKECERQYNRIWLFENEPVNLNLVAKHCPSIGLVFIESTHSGREQAALTLDRITHFEVDLSEFEGKWKPNIGKA